PTNGSPRGRDGRGAGPDCRQSSSSQTVPQSCCLPGSSRRGSGERQALSRQDRKSTRLNSSHLGISYAVFCLKKKKQKKELWLRKQTAAEDYYRLVRFT